VTEPDLIAAYHARQTVGDQVICDLLREVIDSALPEASSKIWHAHPVWFLDGNPVVGYSRLRDGIRLLFWSGQSFNEPGLKGEGKFKSAEVRYASAGEIELDRLRGWLHDAREIQWDYKNIVKRRGVLERLK
jgi:hypothetical protein